eukprot:TRINITY_DN1081_c0_g1_i5.p1 TRINITY_DN1081_c0_g1~~TRINITY_DN1081_c0_g1_i5.p1  ORF type:complete len:189 (+),score=39.01 TRINITY_DN1081_c0_g1_i5:44-610(+)
MKRRAVSPFLLALTKQRSLQLATAACYSSRVCDYTSYSSSSHYGTVNYKDGEQYLNEQTESTTISPHVTIYKFPLPAITSIATRVTGVVLTAGVLGVGVGAAVGCDVIAAIEAFKATCPILVPVTKFAIVAPFAYHFISGVRHLYWDTTAQGITVKAVTQTSYLVLAATALVTLYYTFTTIKPEDQDK